MRFFEEYIREIGIICALLFVLVGVVTILFPTFRYLSVKYRETMHARNWLFSPWMVGFFTVLVLLIYYKFNE